MMKGINLDKLGLREKLGLFLALVFLFALLGDRLVVQSFVKGVKRVNTEARIAQTELKHNLNVLARKSRVETEFVNLAHLLDEAGSPSEMSERMKDEVDGMARTAGVDVRAMKHRPPRDLGYCQEYAVEIGDFEATMEGLLNFLNQISGTPGMMRVIELKVVPQKDGMRKGSMLITKVTLPASEADTAVQ